ncbi:MAG: hypothetical protein ACI943_000572 [Gammaproteobacteria bacterium]|jgi:hypothetical protein
MSCFNLLFSWGMTRITFFLGLLFFLGSATSANGQKSRDWITLGDQSAQNSDWMAAMTCYQKAFELDSAEFDYALKYAEALRMTRDYEKAEYYYAKTYGKDRGKIYKQGQFWLAMMQKQNGHYSEALRNFKKYSKKVKRESEGYEYRKCIQEIEACTWSINERRNDSEVHISKLDDPISTPASDLGSWLLEDSTFIYSSASKKGKNIPIRIWNSYADSIYSKPDQIKAGSLPQQANVCFENDGKTVYFCDCGTDNRCSIMRGEWKDGKIEGSEKLINVNKSEYTSTMPHWAIVGGREVLFFVTDRAGGEGKLDIWWSELQGGQPQPPVNCSDKINTPDNEVTPFYLDGHLYFSSDWHVGFGGFDVFKSKGVHRDFGEADNLGYPINSAANDLYYSYFSWANTGYFASNRPGSYITNRGLCCNDIYQIQYTDSITEEVPDEYATFDELNQYLPVTLYFHNDEPNPNSRDTTTSLSYQDAYKSYSALRSKYIKENTKGLKNDARENAEFDVEDFYDFYVEKGIKDLEVFSKLLLVELEEGRNIELIIRGFASPRAESDYNVNLTKRRTQSLINYLEVYGGGVLRPFMLHTSAAGGSLDFLEIPYGEVQADQQVSDVLNDEKESIYSRGARLERKIMIESVQKGEAVPRPVVSFTELEHDFGTISSRFPVEYDFQFTNTGLDTLYIDSLFTPCGCTVPEISIWEIPPGGTSELKVIFDPQEKKGHQKKNVTLYMNEGAEIREIWFEADVED